MKVPITPLTPLSQGIEVVRVKSWEQYAWLRHGFSTRWGGVSSAYGCSALNLGWTKEDDPGFVRENRERFTSAVVDGIDGDTPFALVGVRQVHSAIVHELRDSDSTLDKIATTEGKPVLEGDGLITDQSGVLIAIGTADCVPVLVADTGKKVVGAFHAGWRGTVERIVETGIARMQQSYGSRTEDLIAAIGPSIGPCCYAVGDEVHAAFASKFTYADQLFGGGNAPEPWRLAAAPNSLSEKQPRSVHLDLWEANRRQLLEAGLTDARITVLKACTACSRNSEGKLQYFSHRGEGGIAGRMLSVIGTSGLRTDAEPERNLPPNNFLL